MMSGYLTLRELKPIREMCMKSEGKRFPEISRARYREIDIRRNRICVVGTIGIPRGEEGRGESDGERGAFILALARSRGQPAPSQARQLLIISIISNYF